MTHKPLIHLGLDLGVKRDSAALAGVFRDPKREKYMLWGHRVVDPKEVGQVDVASLTDLVVKICRTERVGGVHYDPWQMYSEAQRMAKMGFSHLLHECNQQTESVMFSNNLSSSIDQGNLILYSDPTIGAHFSWTGAEITERGYRIVKRNQNKAIDLTIAIAMALHGAMRDYSQHRFSSFYDEDRDFQAEALP